MPISRVTPDVDDGATTGSVNEQSKFWSAVAKKYDRVADLQIGPKTRSLIRERLAREGRLGSVAEFGCGTGFFTSVLADKSDRLVATDISTGMLEAAKHQVTRTNVTFQTEDCQKTSFADGAFDTAFIGLVIHFTEPAKTLAEMRRVLKPGGTLIIANVDPQALTGLDRFRSRLRVLYQGLVGYRTKPPARFGGNVMTEKRLRESLQSSGFRVVTSETIRDASHSSYIPIEYIRAEKL